MLLMCALCPALLPEPDARLVVSGVPVDVEQLPSEEAVDLAEDLVIQTYWNIIVFCLSLMSAAMYHLAARQYSPKSLESPLLLTGLIQVCPHGTIP